MALVVWSDYDTSNFIRVIDWEVNRVTSFPNPRSISTRFPGLLAFYPAPAESLNSSHPFAAPGLFPASPFLPPPRVTLFTPSRFQCSMYHAMFFSSNQIGAGAHRFSAIAFFLSLPAFTRAVRSLHPPRFLQLCRALSLRLPRFPHLRMLSPPLFTLLIELSLFP